MPANTRVGGAWKDVTAIHTRVGGSWKAVTQGHTRVSGSWKQFFAPGGGYWAGQWTSDGIAYWSRDVKIDSVNEYIYVLVEYTDAAAVQRAAIVQMDYDGTINWQRTVPQSFLITPPIEPPNGASFALDADGNVYWVTRGAATGGNAESEIIKLNPAGTVLVQTRITGGFFEGGAHIKIVGSNVYVGGQTLGSFRWRVAKLTTSLNAVTWYREYQVPSDQGQWVTGLEVDSAGDVYLTGRALTGGGVVYRVAVIKVSTTGTLLWQRWIDSSAIYVRSPQVYSGFLYLLAGSTVFRINASTGVLDTAFGRTYTNSVSRLIIDPTNGTYYRGGMSRLNTTQVAVRYAAENSAFVQQFNNQLIITGGTPSTTDNTHLPFYFDFAGTRAVSSWGFNGMNQPAKMAVYAQDGSTNSGATTLGSNSYTWSTSTSGFSSSTPAVYNQSYSLATASMTVNNGNLTVSNGTLTLTKGILV